jgi:hypothetical protein
MIEGRTLFGTFPQSVLLGPLLSRFASASPLVIRFSLRPLCETEGEEKLASHSLASREARSEKPASRKARDLR